MNKDELLGKLTQIGTIEEAAERRAVLTEVSDVVSGLFDTNETLTATNQKFEADNKKLQEYNMQLFLKVGGQKKSVPMDDEGKDEPKKDLKYEDLFDEKGELK